MLDLIPVGEAKKRQRSKLQAVEFTLYAGHVSLCREKATSPFNKHFLGAASTTFQSYVEIIHIVHVVPFVLPYSFSLPDEAFSFLTVL